MNHAKWSAALTALSLSLVSCSYAAIFEKIGDVDQAYGEKSVLVSDDGNVVLSIRAGGGPHLAFLWKVSEGIVKQYPISVGALWPTGMSGDGNVIVGWTYPDGVLGPHDASFDGTVIVGARGTFPLVKAFRVDAGGQIVDLGDLPGGDVSSRALAVSADGNSVVGFSSGQNSYRQPFRWTAQQGMMALGLLPGATNPSGYAQDVSADGTIIVGWAASSQTNAQAFRWMEATGMQSLGGLPEGSYGSRAYAISADGRTVVGQVFVDGFFSNQAFIWTESRGMQALSAVLEGDYGLDLQGLRLWNATGVSADGRVIVGWGSAFNGGNFFAWRVDLIPESSCLTLIAVGGTCLWFVWSRSRRNRSGASMRIVNHVLGQV